MVKVEDTPCLLMEKSDGLVISGVPSQKQKADPFGPALLPTN